MLSVEMEIFPCSNDFNFTRHDVPGVFYMPEDLVGNYAAPYSSQYRVDDSQHLDLGEFQHPCLVVVPLLD